MIHSYPQNWRSLSNDDALIFMRRWLGLDEKAIQLRSEYVKDALPGKKVASFFQLDERITKMINLEFASQLPLVRFISDLIDKLEAEYNIDPSHIAADGMSNGGGMVFFWGLHSY